MTLIRQQLEAREREILAPQAAKAADIHESRLSHIVNGHREANDAEQKIIAKILKRKVADLFPARKAVA